MIKIFIYVISQFVCLNLSCQTIESIDSSTVYIISIFNYYTDSLNNNKDNGFGSDTPNSLQVMILENDENFNPGYYQRNLITGDNHYNYISKKDTCSIQLIHSLINNHSIANLYFLTPLYEYMLDSIDFKNSDQILVSKYFELKKQDEIKKYFQEHFMTSDYITDIVDNRLVNDFMLILEGPFLNTYIRSQYENKCPFIETGMYYMLLKVKMIYLIVNDKDEFFIKNRAPWSLQIFNKTTKICKYIPTKISYYQNSTKKLLAFPIYVKPLKPFNDIQRVYIFND